MKALDLLRSRLDEIKMTNAEMAHRMGRTPQYVTDVFKGKKKFTIALALEVALVLQMDEQELVLALLEDEKETRYVAERLEIIAEQNRQREQRLENRLRRNNISAWKQYGRLRDIPEDKLAKLEEFLAEL